MKTPVDRNGFAQICIVVEDAKKAAEGWAELFGIPAPEIEERHLEGNEEYVYRGKRISCDLLVAEIAMNGFIIELHQPVMKAGSGADESTFHEFMREHGNGVHHLGFEVGNKRDAIVSELTEAGYEQRTVGIYPGSSWTIIDSEDTLGVNLNIKPVR